MKLRMLTSALLLAAALVPARAVAQAHPLQSGGWMKCRGAAPIAPSGTGILWCDSNDSNKLHYTDPSGAGIALGSGGGGGTFATTYSSTASDNRFQPTLTGGPLLGKPSSAAQGDIFRAESSSGALLFRVNDSDDQYLVAPVGKSLHLWPNGSGSGATLTLSSSGLTVTGAAVVASVALTDGATINTDATLGNSFGVTLAGNRTMANPTGLVSGGTYQWEIIQDATGSRTLTWGSTFKWPGGSAPTLLTAAGAKDLISCYYDGTDLLCGSLAAGGGGSSYSAGTGLSLSSTTFSIDPTQGQNMTPTDATYSYGDATHRLTGIGVETLYSGSVTASSVSGVADGVGTVAFDHNTSNALTDSSTILDRWRVNGTARVQLKLPSSSRATICDGNGSGIDVQSGETDIFVNGNPIALFTAAVSYFTTNWVPLYDASLTIGSDSHGIKYTQISPAAAPGAPASGWRIYVDSGDGNKLKAIASTGTIATLGTP